jgi:hypothetical protein
MHLHGRIANARLGIAASNLVLTSADFGEAYLRSGWASSFVYDLLRRYALVFVGYSADDPPMRYMLEATEAGRLYFRDLRRAYAFAPFDDNSASDEGNVFARWRAKGLVPILYQNCDQSHDSLYRSLSAWAKCARDPGAWAGAEIARIAGTPFAATSERTRAKVKYLTTTMSNATALSNCAGSPDWIECLIDKNSPPYLRERDANLWYAQRLADQAAVNREKRGLGKPETFNFLGFTFICGKSRGGRFLVHRKTRRDRMQAKLKEVKEQLRRRRHQPIPEQGKWLRQVVTGHFVYYAVPTNSRALSAFRQHVTDLWRRTLRRRSQRDGTTWDRMAKLSDDWLPKPHILHPWPSQRFAVTHPR